MFPGGQGGPLMHVIAAKAVAFREALAPGFRDYCAAVIANAARARARASRRGYRVVSGGTDTHLFLLSLVDRELTGKAAEARWSAPASRPTRTWCRSIRASPR